MRHAGPSSPRADLTLGGTANRCVLGPGREGPETQVKERGFAPRVRRHGERLKSDQRRAQPIRQEQKRTCLDVRTSEKQNALICASYVTGKGTSGHRRLGGTPPFQVQQEVVITHVSFHSGEPCYLVKP